MRRGLPENAFDGRPHIAIANSASDLTPCNSHLNEVMESVKAGIYEAGGIPLNLPVVSLGETQVRPTAMLWRNMAAMATEEMLRANPIDGVVLLGGCDKTIPSLLMAAASVDIPAIVVPGGPMKTGTFAATIRFHHDETITGCDEKTAVVTRNGRADPAVEIELVGLFDKRTVDAAEEYGAALDIDPQDLRLVGNPHRTLGENMTMQ